MACARVSVMALLAALPFSPLSAEITLDGTMGPAGPLEGPAFTIADTLGTTQGANLFHSFSVFNIDSTESATFTGPAGLDNVISRVTGGTPSSIDGLFRSTVPGADVYFINPFGVIFGQNASLDVQGAFHAATADELRFADGNVFSASNPIDTVLTPAAPEAFGFLGANPAGITVNDSVLAVPTGETLSLVGGDITITGTDRNRPSPHLEAASGRLNLVSVAASGGVVIAGGVLDASGFAAHGNITLADSRLEVSGSPGGAVYIEGGNIVLDSSHVWSDSSGPADGGDITLKGDSIFLDHEDLRVSSSTVIGAAQPRIRTSTSGAGRGGDIYVEGGALTINRGSRINTKTIGTGRGGDIRENLERLEIRDGYIAVSTEGPGRSGDHIVNADSILIATRAGSRDTGFDTESGFDNHNAGAPGNLLVTARTIKLIGPRAEFGIWNHGVGNAGDLVINAESLVIEGNDGVFIGGTAGDGTGDAANITLNVGRLEMLTGASIASVSFSTAPAGDINITADSILVSAEGNFTTLTHIASFSIFGPGNVGDVNIQAHSLEVLEGGSITASALGTGSGGNITITVDDLLVDGGGTIFPRQLKPPTTLAECACFTAGTTHISASTPFAFSGLAGDVNITANNVTVRGGAAIEAISGGANPGGNVTIDAGSVLLETDGRIDTGSIGSGDGGDIFLSAGDLVLAHGGNVIASSTGTGLAGDVFISLTDSFRSDGGFVNTEATASDGGNITLNAVTMVDLLNSSITTSVQGGAGAGGNINIDPQFVIVQNSNIIANAFGGPGGNINIAAGLFLIDTSSTITASSALGIDGIINVNSPVADVTSGVTELPANVLDASTLVQAPCAAQTAGTSSLTSAGRSGLPAGPDGYLPSPGFGLATTASATVDADNIPVSVRDAIDGGPALQLAMTGLECS